MKTAVGTSISAAAALLRAGKLVAIPTETVYGLAGHGLHPPTVAEIFAVKDRPSFDPMILHTSSLAKLEGLIGTAPPSLQRLADVFMPGPLSILVEKIDAIPDITTAGLPRVAIRIPSHPVSRALLQELDFPLAAPSANPFGYVSPTNAQHVADQLDGKIPYILDGGSSTVGLESTIVEWTGEQVRVLRKGSVTIEDIEAIVGPVLVSKVSTSSPAAPGMLKSHYATTTPITLEPLAQILQQHKPDRIGMLSWCTTVEQLPARNCKVLSETADLQEAAQNLFAYMRLLDSKDIDIIVAELLPERGLGRAINDKLRRASV